MDNNINNEIQNNNVEPITINSNNVSNTTITPPTQVYMNPHVNSQEEEELLKAFIGENYDKITKDEFNVSGFFLKTLYMFYRKMMLYGVLICIVNYLASFVFPFFPIVLHILLGFLVNKIYIGFAKKKIQKIKNNNPGADMQTLKNICAASGGTSIGHVVLGFLAEAGILIVLTIIVSIALLFFIGGLASIFDANFDESIYDDNIKNEGIYDEEENFDKEETIEGTLLPDVQIKEISSSTTMTSVFLKNDTTTYTYKGKDERKFLIYSTHNKDVRFDIYYKPNGFSREIVGYKAYLRETNEDVTNIQHEGELREKMGLYGLGKHTDEFTFIESSVPSEVIKDDGNAYRKFYIFTDKDNNKYRLQYIYKENPPILIEGQKYTVTFETKLSSLNCYDYLIEVK